MPPLQQLEGTGPAERPENLIPGDDILSRYREVRHATDRLAAPLAVEDTVVQSMPDASPVKWHLAHTTCFFETFLLSGLPGYEPHHPDFSFLFNSYYNAVGPRHSRPKRGLITRPTLDEVHSYRSAVDDRLMAEIAAGTFDSPGHLHALVLGLNHEQQHQELILTDVKHLLGSNPLKPVYRLTAPAPGWAVPPIRWVEYAGGLQTIGHEGNQFAFDNERPRHRRYLEPFRFASRLVTNGEYLAFIADNGYRRPELWLSDGWNAVQEQGWTAPLYWDDEEGSRLFTLGGVRDIDLSEPVCHVSYYEADAFARWAGARLPDEAEWETVAAKVAPEGNFVESERFHPATVPAAASAASAPAQLFGDVWEWTKSPYTSYPGYAPPAGALGEYNAKFMCNQLVLRGGSCATPASHIRATYRNFFPPDARWQFMGIRLAKDAV